MDFYVKTWGLLRCCIFWERSSAEIIANAWFDAFFILILVPELLQKLKYLGYKLEQRLGKLYLYIHIVYTNHFFSANPLHWVCSGKYFPLVYGLTYFCKTSLQIRTSTQGLDSEMESVHVPRTGKFRKCGWNSRCPNCVTQVLHGEPVLAFLCSRCILLVVDGAWMMRFYYTVLGL